MSQLALACPSILQIKRKEKEKKNNIQNKRKEKEKEKKADLPSHDNIPAFYTSHTPSMILLFPWYTTPTLIGMPCQGCSPYSAPAPFVIRHMLDSFSISFTAPFVAWPHVPPPLLLASSFPFPKGDTPCTCVPPLHI